MTAPPTGLVYFTGPPQRLQSVCSIMGPDAELDFSPGDALRDAMPADGLPVRVRTSGRSGSARLTLRMDYRTPPGRYQAVVKVGNRSIPAEIHVAPSPRLKTSPAGLTFQAAAGESAVQYLALENAGNIPIEIPEVATAGIYDDNGIETAFASTYRQEGDDVQQLLGHLLGKLREGHGGLLKLRIPQGACLLRPGESRMIQVESRLPVKLKAGHSYHGVWHLEPLHAAVRVVVLKLSQGDEK